MSESKLNFNTFVSGLGTFLSLLLVSLAVWFGGKFVGYGEAIAGLQITVDRISKDTVPRPEFEIELARLRDSQLRLEARMLEQERKK